MEDECGDKGLDLRGTFIIDPKGILRHMAVNDLPVGRSPVETLRLVDALQFTSEHPDQGCPVNWTPGKPSIKTDPIGAQDYFKNEL